VPDRWAEPGLDHPRSAPMVGPGARVCHATSRRVKVTKLDGSRRRARPPSTSQTSWAATPCLACKRLQAQEIHVAGARSSTYLRLPLLPSPSRPRSPSTAGPMGGAAR